MLKNELIELSNDPLGKGQEWRDMRDKEYDDIANDEMREIAEVAGSLNLGKAMGRNFLVGELQEISYIDNIKKALKDAASVGCMSWIFKHDTVYLPKDKITELEQMCKDEKLTTYSYDNAISVRWME